jgi:hypothetical protein
MRGYNEAIKQAQAGSRWTGGGRGGMDIIPGLYGMQNRLGWARWAPTEAERIANVNRLYGVDDSAA